MRQGVQHDFHMAVVPPSGLKFCLNIVLFNGLSSVVDALCEFRGTNSVDFQ